MTLEELLNKLIEKGWCVFGHRERINAERCNYIEGNYYSFDNHNISISLRELVSINSGLRQFVCENGMINIPGYKSIIHQGVDTKRHKYYGKDYRYWLCESALKDESELEQFLLQSIKIEG